MLLCFNFLTETATWIGRVNYRGAVGNLLLFVGFFPWKLDVKSLGKCVQNILLYRYAAKSKQTQVTCFVGQDWMKPGRSNPQPSRGAGISEGSTGPLGSARGHQPGLQWPLGLVPAWLGAASPEGNGLLSQGRLMLHYTENCFSLC